MSKAIIGLIYKVYSFPSEGDGTAAAAENESAQVNQASTPNNAVTTQRRSQFTPKMKANALPRLLSSLLCIDQYNECNGNSPSLLARMYHTYRSYSVLI